MTSDNNDNNIPGFAEIVNQLQGLVYNTVLGIVQNETDAEDVTQEVFIQIHESLAGYKGEAKSSTWAYRIAINKALDFEKRKKAQRRGGLFKRVFNTAEAEEPVSFYHPGVALEQKEEAAVLFNAIDKLPEKQKIVFFITQNRSHALYGNSRSVGNECAGCRISNGKGKTKFKNIFAKLLPEKQ